MSISEKLETLQGVDGYLGFGVFTPAGEVLASHVEKAGFNIKEVGIHANHILLNAQKASMEMGTGGGHLVHIETDKANILVTCMNEGPDCTKTLPGKTHVHAVMVLQADAEIGLAKLKLDHVVKALADDFRL
jgi:predicted regulator of Ras-like GTPase activity (Roadblock/LC7/MglB family)